MGILRKIITLILVMLIGGTLTSTTQFNIFADSRLNSNSRMAKVAVIFHRIDDPYQMRLMESLGNIEKDSRNNIKYTFFDSKNNIAIQNEVLDSVLKNNYDLLILNLADKNENAVQNVIENVKQRNTPVILLNIPQEVVAKVSKLYDKAAFVGPESKNAGIAEGKIIVDLWNRDKNVIDHDSDDVLQYILLEGKSDDPQAIDRTKYAILTINDSGIKTQQLAVVDAGWLRDLAKTSINNLFLKYNGQIEAIIANNDAMALGAIEALQRYGYNAENGSQGVVIVGIDGLPEAIDLIDKGIMTGTVIQDPNVSAQLLYTVGMNLINNLNPTENTNYNISNGVIIIPFPYNIYTGKSNNK